MPTYEYRCKDCGTQLEVVQAFSDDPLTECPECQGSLKKVFHSVGIAFKGSGFYKNDSRSGSSTGSSSSSGAAGTSSSESSSGTGGSSGSGADSGSSSSSGSDSSGGSAPAPKAEAKTA